MKGRKRKNRLGRKHGYGQGLLRLHMDIDKPVDMYIRHPKPPEGSMSMSDMDGWEWVQLKNIRELR